jgi:outer membrane protein OmpA-like peptidoglycan-associated protein
VAGTLKTGIRAIALAALAGGLAHAGTVSDRDARTYVLSAFITGAAPAILSQDVRVAPDLRARLGLPETADRNAVYEALFALTDGKPFRVSGPASGMTLETGEINLTLQYDVVANNIAYVGLPAPKVAAVPPAAPPPARPTVLALPPLLFDFDHASLDEQASARLRDENLKRASAIRITGHADPVGEAQYNLELSQRRAEAVRAQLIELGVDAKRIEVGAAGAPESDACAAVKEREARIACLAPERRVDITVELPAL